MQRLIFPMEWLVLWCKSLYFLRDTKFCCEKAFSKGIIGFVVPVLVTPNLFSSTHQFLCKTDANPLWRLPLPPVHLPYSILLRNWWKSSLATHSSSSTHSLFNPYSILMNILLGAPLSSSTPSFFIFYSKLMKILSGASLLTCINPYQIQWISMNL